MFKRINIEIEPITYLHIGSGEELNPLKYIIKNNFIYLVNETAAINSLANKYAQKFNQIMETADLVKIHMFIAENLDIENHEVWFDRYQVDDQFINYYKNKINKPENQNFVDEFIRTEINKSPYIPGSSLKGAIRTAILSYLMEQKQPKESIKRQRSQTLEVFLLNSLDRNKRRFEAKYDPFKYLRISDTAFENKNLNIKEVVNTKKNKIKKRPYSFQEFLNMDNNNKKKKNLTWYAEVLDTNKIDNLKSSMDIHEKFFNILSINNIPKIINWFYKYELKKDEKFYKYGKKKEVYLKLLEMINSVDDNEFMVKMGKHSGKNYLSFKEFHYKTKTRNLIDNLPLGWLKIKMDI